MAPGAECVKLIARLSSLGNKHRNRRNSEQCGESGMLFTVREVKCFEPSLRKYSWIVELLV